MVTAGDLLEFSVEASYDADSELLPEISWWKNNVKIEPNSRIQVSFLFL